MSRRRTVTSRSAGDQLTERLRAVALRAIDRCEPMPSEPKLVKVLGVSRPSLREALARLEAEGLIRRRQGAETIVNIAALDMTARFDQQVAFADVLAAAGFQPSVEVLCVEVVELGGDDAGVLQREAGAPALRTIKRWLADEQPAMVAIDVVPATDAAHLDGLDPSRELFDLAAELGGEAVEWELAWPGAHLPTGNLRRWLGTAVRDPVLTLDLVGVGRTGRRLYRATEFHVPGVVRSGFIRSVAQQRRVPSS